MEEKNVINFAAHKSQSSVSEKFIYMIFAEELCWCFCFEKRSRAVFFVVLLPFCKGCSARVLGDPKNMAHSASSCLLESVLLFNLKNSNKKRRRKSERYNISLMCFQFFSMFERARKSCFILYQLHCNFLMEILLLNSVTSNKVSNIAHYIVFI